MFAAVIFITFKVGLDTSVEVISRIKEFVMYKLDAEIDVLINVFGVIFVELRFQVWCEI
jgi:hypothetical protein